MFQVKNKLRSFLAIAVLSFLSSCALTPDTARLSYLPQVGVVKLQRADTVIVKVEAIDSRTVKDKVSVKKNAYGMEMAPITSEEDVVSLLKRAIELELENCGFHLGAGKVLVFMELSKFYNDFKIGFWAGDAVAELVMNAQVKNSDGNVIYSKNITGEGINKDIQLSSGENAQVALDAALKDAVSKLFQDPQFIESILKAGMKV